MTSIIIETLDANGKKYQKAYPNVNPNATNAQLKSFAMTVTNLTDNVYTGGTRVIKVDLDDEYDPNN